MAAGPDALPCLQRLADGSLLLRLQVQPRAAANHLAGLQGDMLKLRVTTPPVDGKANQAVVAYLAKLFHLPKSSVVLKSGHQSRGKTVVIASGHEQEVRAVLAAHLFPERK
ncbi:protein of unknown function DUF167 [Desulfobulbus propionicus DSM 2032]|jgi:uncharacterized protein (TIGR00251 family)|uniref:UPF0235 protein Despr_0318 n=1 Tax=Desulfobulbus propionicus (strain ATCC 33891 / DSM 2032 / VKM B-1956 / 1pr3) TaxID=577650 RepID=A0A7U3YJE8_DESPD|nr:DUF167 domain-containing protein [Desulfobulbus propionicus]ADW16502.1 protein of unknown function DUF167 [Desulfobulbus propionicus DSM 2032]